MRIRDRIAGGIAALAMRNLGAVTNRVVFVQSHDDPLDHYRRASDDCARRSLAKRLSQRFWADHQQPQYHSVGGSVFIELALVLPVLMTVVWGSIAVFQVLRVNFALNEAATVGIQVVMEGRGAATLERAVDRTLANAGVNPNTVSLFTETTGLVAVVRLSTSLKLPVIGSVAVTATQQSYAPL